MWRRGNKINENDLDSKNILSMWSSDRHPFVIDSLNYEDQLLETMYEEKRSILYKCLLEVKYWRRSIYFCFGKKCS